MKANNSVLRFSVIMCAYNLEKIVSVAINSVLEQTFENYELILVNDGSSDNTLEILRNFEKLANGKIRVINNEKNVGLSASRNIAINQAKGEYIVHLDGDDTLYDINTLEEIDKTIGNRKLDICYFGVQYIGGGNKIYLPNAKNSTREARITCDMHFAVASKVWRREFLNENNITFIEDMYYEDMVYSIKSAIKAKEISFGEFPIYVYYRNREGSIMATPNVKRCKDMYKMLYHLMELYEETPEELQPYLLSFIKNETYGVPVRVDGILRSLKDSTYTPVFPKRNYVFTEETPTIIEVDENEKNNYKIIPISLVQNEQNIASGGVSLSHGEELEISAAPKKDLKIIKFENT
jgi:glycosyltransferase involved in cell wall biosynthesis